MTDYALAYDLVKEQSSHDYEPLWAELKRLGGHRTEYSLWLINVNNTAKETCDQLRNYLDKDDRLWVLELTENHYFANATGGTNDWIMNNPPESIGDPPHSLGLLLRSRRERPRSRSAAEQRDEIAALQLIELHSVPVPGPDC